MCLRGQVKTWHDIEGTRLHRLNVVVIGVVQCACGSATVAFEVIASEPDDSQLGVPTVSIHEEDGEWITTPCTLDKDESYLILKHVGTANLRFEAAVDQAFREINESEWNAIGTKHDNK